MTTYERFKNIKIRLIYETNDLGLFISRKDHFIGFKYKEKNKYYICFLSYTSEGKIFATYRDDINLRDSYKVDVEDMDDERLIKNMVSFLKDALEKKPSKIIASGTDPDKIETVRVKKWFEEEHLGMSLRLSNGLERGNINSLEEFLNASDEDILAIPNVGRKCVREANEIKKMLKERKENEKEDNARDELKEQNFNLSKETLELLEEEYNEENVKKIPFVKVNISETKFNFEDVKKSDLNLEIEDDPNGVFEGFASDIINVTLETLKAFSTERQYNIFVERMGLGDDKPMTLEAVGKIHSVTRERIRQIVDRLSSRWNLRLKQRYFDIINELDYSYSQMDYLVYGLRENTSESFVTFVLKALYGPKGKTLAGKVFSNYEKLLRKRKTDAKSKQYQEKWTEKVFSMMEEPSSLNKDTKEIFDSFKPTRDWYNPRTEILEIDGDMIIYESGEEKRSVELLKSLDCVKEVKTQGLKIDYTYEGKKRVYYPDLQVLFEDGTIAVIEVKPFIHIIDDVVMEKYKALGEYCEKNGFRWGFLNSHFKNYSSIENLNFNPEKEEILYNEMKKRKYIRFSEFRLLKNKYGITNHDMMHAVYTKEDLCMKAYPFVLFIKERHEDK